MIEKKVSVDLGDRSYHIHIAEHWSWQQIREDLAGRQYFIISDDHVAPLYLESLKSEVDHCIGHHIIKAGEASKSMAVAEEVHGSLIKAGASRSCACIALGGGVVGDLAGFVASTYMRGIPFIQMPTSLLAMVDSSVGGKVAVNHPLGKNMIGHFYQPLSVHIATQSLSTLPKREIAAGFAEVIKYGILSDKDFFEWLESSKQAILSLEASAISKAVDVSVRIKADIVARDETETSGVRALLNLGHTFGHAEEVLRGYGEILHGEAVAAGMVAACHVSEAMGQMTQAEVQRVEALIESSALPRSLKTSKDHDAFWKSMQSDKKSDAGQVYFIIPETIGVCALPQVLERKFVEGVLAKI